MKKLLVVLLLASMISVPAQARPFHHSSGHHRPFSKIVYKSHHHSVAPLVALASGLVGFAIGSATAAPIKQTATYTIPTNTQQCFAVVSRSTGNVTQRCVSNYNGENQVLYVD